MKTAALSTIVVSALLSSVSFASTPYPSNSQLLIQPTLDKPLPGQTFVGADFGGTITRLTDSSQGNKLYDGSHYIKADYSRIQAENADGSKILIYAVNQNQLMQYALANTDGSDIQFINLPQDNVANMTLMHDETEARWHPENPALIRFISGQNSYVGSLKVFEYNWQNNTVSVLADLEGKLPAKWGKGLYGMTHLEGEYSADGNRLAWSIENSKENSVGYVTFDLRGGGVVLGTKTYDKRGHNNLSISPSGRYVSISSTDSTSYFPVDFSSETLIGEEAQHGDFCVTAEGKDCYITVSFDNQSDPLWGWIYTTELDTGIRTPLMDVWALGNTSMHFSGRGHDAQGWALMSTYNCHMGDPLQTATNLCSRNFLVELKENPKIYSLNWNHATGETYYSEPHATMSRDAKHVYFTSDWMKKNGDVDLYRLDIDPDTFAHIEAYKPPFNPAPMSEVELLAPSDNGRVNSQEPLMFSFAPIQSEAETTYDLQLRQYKSGEVIEETSQAAAADICLPERCDISYGVGLIKAGNRYNWRVRASQGENQSGWSEASIKTESSKALKPAKLKLISPIKNASIDVKQILSFQWKQPTFVNQASAVSHFVLKLTDATNRQLALNVEIPFSACVEGTCSFTPEDLSLNESKKHRWTLQAFNDVGKSALAKSRFKYIALDRVKPTTATLLTPAANTTVQANTNITLSWQSPAAPNESSIATQFDLIVYDRKRRSVIVNLRKIDATTLCDSNGLCQYSENITVQAGKKHFWRVRARNAAGNSKWVTAKFNAE